MKEEGDASDTNQSYDKAVAKEGKKNIRYLLYTCRKKIKNTLQYEFISTCIIDLKQVKHVSYTNLFKKVNLHPDFHKD